MRNVHLIVLTLAALALPNPAARVRAQLTDLQPGRNFVKSSAFGINRSENIDPGDIDNDGDMDVLVANGGDFGPEPDRIFVNNGALQGGTIGTFTDETATRMAGAPADDSRDGEFVDIDNDGDLDIEIANSGVVVNGGEPDRIYVNRGGLQGGTIGYFQEESNTRWGTLVSVPLAKQLLGGNAGPFKDYSCDCDFADLNDDGSNDLFHSSYGPVLDGNIDSRVFLNDGNGVFNELWPWANAGSDTKVHTADVDLADFEGDFDIDVIMSSRNSTSRTWMNNLYGGASASPFQDLTQSAIIATGAMGSNTVNYECEYGDVDGDGDFDVWMLNDDGNLERILVTTVLPGGGYKFTKKLTWIKGDPNQDENEVDFSDYDNDGDLDAFVANFSGTSSLYESGLAQGLDPETQGLFHNTGTGGTGNLATAFPEMTTNWDLGTQLDADWCDVDNDGDDDILVACDGNQQNYLVTNALGVPDTHAPTIWRLSLPSGQPNGTDTAIHAAIRDNAAFYNVSFYSTVLKYRVNGGAEQSLPMATQGSQQFRGVIPAQTDAFVSYFAECTDLAGNTGVSVEQCFKQGAPPDLGAWADISFGLAGVSGVPALAGSGTQLGGCTVSLALGNAKPSAPAALFVGLVNNPTAFKGGFLVPTPALVTLSFTTSPLGEFTLPFTWPSGVPSAFSLYYQCAVKDSAAIAGAALSNALQSTTP